MPLRHYSLCVWSGDKTPKTDRSCLTRRLLSFSCAVTFSLEDYDFYRLNDLHRLDDSYRFDNISTWEKLKVTADTRYLVTTQKA
jgi:hypothetical protein